MMLSILIPTLPESTHYLNRITNILRPQIEKYIGEVEILTDETGKHQPTGTKRNNLIAKSQAEYFCFVDVDDTVPMYYVNEIMISLQSVPDVVTFKGHMTTNGGDRRDFTIKLGERYEERNRHYYRFPNHLCVFKKSLVSYIKFPDIWQQEDYQWARQINDRKLLKSEIHIDKEMYHYDYKSKKGIVQR